MAYHVYDYFVCALNIGAHILHWLSDCIFEKQLRRLDISGLGLNDEFLDNFADVPLKKGPMQGAKILLLCIKTRATLWIPAMSLLKLPVVITFNHL